MGNFQPRNLLVADAAVETNSADKIGAILFMTLGIGEA